MTTAYYNHANLLALLRSAADARRAAAEPGTPSSITVGAQMRLDEALRCCEMAGTTAAARRQALIPPGYAEVKEGAP